MGQQISASQLDKIRNQIRKRQNEQGGMERGDEPRNP